MSSVTNKIYISEDVKIKIPSNMIMGGPTMSGKTEDLKNFVKYSQEMYIPPPKSIIYAYGGKFDEQYLEFGKYGAQLISGFPDEELIESQPKPLLLILDDLILDANAKYLQDLFTRTVHHQNLGLILVTQNFHDKIMVYLKKNAQYLYIKNSPSSELDLQGIQRQIFPRKKAFLYGAYQSISKHPFGYILIDLHPKTKPELRLRTNIFPFNGFPTIFLE